MANEVTSALAAKVEERQELEGIDLLRAMVRLFDSNREGFNQRFTVDGLLQIAKAHFASEWEFYPDQWEEWQVHDALEGMAPKWDRDEKPVRQQAARAPKSDITPGPWDARGDVSFDVMSDSPCRDLICVAADLRSMADAQLIAAAPDLLQTLKNVLEQVDGYDLKDEPFASARAAIAKAGGK